MQFKVTSRAFFAGLVGYCNYTDRSFKASESTVGVIAIVGKKLDFGFCSESNHLHIQSWLRDGLCP